MVQRRELNKCRNDRCQRSDSAGLGITHASRIGFVPMMDEWIFSAPAPSVSVLTGDPRQTRYLSKKRVVAVLPEPDCTSESVRTHTHVEVVRTM